MGEILEQENQVVETPTEPLIVHTAGEWMSLETLTGKELEVGKTYHIKVKGNCQFMISKDKPSMGITTNEITYKKQADTKLWIKTGE